MDSRPLSTNPKVLRAVTIGTRIGSVLITILLGLGWVLDFEAWRLSVFAGALTAMASLDIATRRAVGVRVSVRRWSAMLLGVLMIQTAVIAATGGIQSPFLPAYIGPVLLTVVILGRRALVMSIVFVNVVIVGLALVYAFGPAGLLSGPTALSREESGWTTLLGGLVVWAILMGGGRLALFVADFIETQRRSMLEAQSAVSEAYEARHRDLLAISGALAHEIKNPLTVVQSLSSLLHRRAKDSHQAAEELGVLLGEVRRMRSTIDEFLDFSRPIGTLVAAPSRLDRIAEDVRAAHAALAAERGVIIQLKAGEALPVVCDERKIKQVIANLLHNAVDASSRGAKVELRIEVQDDEAVVTVEDEGAGISEEIADQLFRPGATTKAQGSGLGLVISRALAEQHHGTLTLKSRETGGCAAQLRLPLTQEVTNA